MRRARTLLVERYELGALLGRGGMADVYEGRDLRLGRRVAVKVLAPPFDRDRDLVERFRGEARAAARLGHPGIVAVFDTGSDGDRHFIVTELVDGEPLSTVLDREGRLPVGRIVEIATQVCRALAAAHEAGIVHRDVKPANVMLTAEGRVKVVDFGIAKAIGADRMTRTGWILGSAAYLAPEQAQGSPGDERSDLYALGCVIHEMLTGRPPFSADSPVSILYQHVNEPPPALPPSVPRALRATVLRCLEKDPDRRFPSALELERALVDARRSDRSPLPLQDAATQPLARYATTPVPDVATRPLARVGTTTPDARPTSRFARGRSDADRRRSRPPLVALAAVAVVMLLAGWLVLDPVGGRDRRVEDGGAAASESGPTGSGSTSVTGAPSSVEDAFAGLLDAIAPAVGGDLTVDAADTLRDRALKLQEHVAEGKTEDLAKDAGEFLRELGKKTEEGKISPSAADAIRDAFAELLALLGVTPEDSPDGHGKEGHEEGPD